MFPTPQLESVDIDTPDDWDMAECVAILMQRRAQEMVA
jgi:hypothetical protein